MKIQNNGEPFELKFDGQDISIPEGLSQSFPKTTAYHIQFTANKWGKNIRIVDTEEGEKEAIAENEAKVETPEETPEETPVETPVETPEEAGTDKPVEENK